MFRAMLPTVRTFAALLLTTTFAACSDQGTVAPPHAATSTRADVTGSIQLPMVQWNTPLATASVVSQYVGSLGGTVSTAGVSLVIPPLALSQTTLITMTVPAGQYVMVDLQPHGLTFQVKPLLLFPVTGTNAGLLGISNLIGVYTTSDPVNGLISVDEAYSMSLIESQLGFHISHFSDYAPADSSGQTQKGLILQGG